MIIKSVDIVSDNDKKKVLIKRHKSIVDQVASRGIDVQKVIKYMEENSNSSKMVHIISKKNEWIVKKNGSNRATSVFKTKQEAMKSVVAGINFCDVIIHDSFGNVTRVTECKPRSYIEGVAGKIRSNNSSQKKGR